jgi:hypothetical protein
MKTRPYKRLALTLALLLGLALLGGCATAKTEKYIASFNASFNGILLLGEKLPFSSSPPDEGFDTEPGFGCYAYKSADGLTSFGVSGYPDALDAYRVTDFSTEDGYYTVFGFSVGDTRAKAEDALARNGYKKIKDSDAASPRFALGRIRIWLLGGETITRIDVRLESTNIRHAVF